MGNWLTDWIGGVLRAKIRGYGSESDVKYQRLASSKHKLRQLDARDRAEGYYMQGWSARQTENLAKETEGKQRVHRSAVAYYFESAGDKWLEAHEPMKAAKDYRKAATNLSKATPKEFYPSHPYDEKEIRNGITRLNRKAERLEKVAKGEWKGLGSNLSAIISGFTLVGSILFFSSTITGYAISDLSQPVNNYAGVVLFIIGIISTFIYLRNK